MGDSVICNGVTDVDWSLSAGFPESEQFAVGGGEGLFERLHFGFDLRDFGFVALFLGAELFT